MDDPEHAQLRALVSQAFTPRRMRTMEDWIREEAVALVDEMIDKGEGDFCDLFAKHLPGRIFADFFGLRDGEDRSTVMDAAEAMLAWDDPEIARGRDALEVYGEEADRMHDICFRLIDERRADPGQDLMSWLVEAEFEGRKLEDWEIGAFFTLLAAAGNDTTRHSLAHALLLFTQHPEQRALLLEDLEGRIDGAVEEVIRHASPVMQFRRTATADTELRGVPIAEGDKVVIWYCSGNHDEAAFDEPSRFDILRAGENRHLGFGGGGPHYCLGSALGRMMLKHGLVDIFTRMPDIKVSGPPVYQVNNFIHGVHQLPVRWSAPAT
jgi:cytochrome P450